MSGNAILLGAGYSWRSGRSVQTDRHPARRPSSPMRTLGLAARHACRWAVSDWDRRTTASAVSCSREASRSTARPSSCCRRAATACSGTTPCAGPSVEVPETGAAGARPTAPAEFFLEPRRFRGASNIAALRGALYVADPVAHRVQVFDLATLALIRIHDGIADPPTSLPSTQGVFILDRGTRRVFRGATRARRSRSRRGRHTAARRSGIAWPSIGPARSTSAIAGRSRRACRCSRRRHAAGHLRVGSHRRQRRDPRPFRPAADLRPKDSGSSCRRSLLDPCGLRRPPEPHRRSWRAGDHYVAIDTRARVVTRPPSRRTGPSPLRPVRRHRTHHRRGCRGRLVARRSRDARTPASGSSTMRIRPCTSGSSAPSCCARRLWRPADFPRRWRRIAADGTGCLLLWDGVDDMVDRVDQRGRRHRMRPVAHGARPVRASESRHAAGRRRATRAGSRETAPSRLAGGVAAAAPEPAYYTHGIWTSQWLDSELYNCQWHVLELDLRTLPPGSRLVVRTRTSNDAQSDAEVLASLGTVGASGAWRDTPALVGEAAAGPERTGADHARRAACRACRVSTCNSRSSSRAAG